MVDLPERDHAEGSGPKRNDARRAGLDYLKVSYKLQQQDRSMPATAIPDRLDRAAAVLWNWLTSVIGPLHIQVGETKTARVIARDIAETVSSSQ